MDTPGHWIKFGCYPSVSYSLCKKSLHEAWIALQLFARLTIIQSAAMVTEMVNADTSSAKDFPVNAIHEESTHHQENKELQYLNLKEINVSAVDPHNICTHSKKSEHLAKAYFKKKKESGHNTTHQVTAMQRAESDPSEDKGDTDNPFTVYVKGMKSSGSTTTTHAFTNLQSQLKTGRFLWKSTLVVL